MTAAAAAMAQAVTSLDGLKTGDALPPEMEALNRLLKAQADVKKREVQRQQAGTGSGSNRSNYDVSSLFDKELQKAQQTNYETKSSSVEQKSDAAQSALDAIKELARRQDELLKRQQELARTRAQMTEEELKRELEKLTREQSELRQKAEELAQKMARRPVRRPRAEGQAGQQGPRSAIARRPIGRSRVIGTVRAVRPERRQQTHARRVRGDAERRKRAAASGSRSGERPRQSCARQAAGPRAPARVGAARTIAAARSATCSSKRVSLPTRSAALPPNSRGRRRATRGKTPSASSQASRNAWPNARRDCRRG